MKKDTSIILSSIIFSTFCYVSDAYGKGLTILVGVVGFIGIISLIMTSSPMKNLTDNEEVVYKFETKYVWLILALSILNIIGFYIAYPSSGGDLNDNRLLLSFTTILGFASLFGFLLGLIISVFPYKKMEFANRFNRGIVLGLIFIHGLVTVMYLVVMIKLLV